MVSCTCLIANVPTSTRLMISDRYRDADKKLELQMAERTSIVLRHPIEAISRSVTGAKKMVPNPDPEVATPAASESFLLKYTDTITMLET